MTDVKDPVCGMTINEKDSILRLLLKGPGLGLTFTKMIIQECEGTISVESKPGNGVAFTIRFPLQTHEQ